MTISLLVSLQVAFLSLFNFSCVDCLTRQAIFKHYGFHSVISHFNFSIQVYFTNGDFKFQFLWSHEEECTFIMPTDL